MTYYLLVIVLLLLAALPLGCATLPPPAEPVARAFFYTPPEQVKQLFPVTIALVRPRYENPTEQMVARMVGSDSWARETGGAFVNSLKTDLEKLLIAKGFKVTGPYDSLDVMTFPEKKGANLTLTPIVEIRADDHVTAHNPAFTGEVIVTPGTQEGVFSVGGWVAFVMVEPLSGEKMWMKRIELEPVQERYSFTYIAPRGGGQATWFYGDTRQQAFTKALNRIYPAVMQKAWAYFDSEEVLHVKQQAEEVRQLKRY